MEEMGEGDPPCGCPVVGESMTASYPGCDVVPDGCPEVKVEECSALESEGDCFESGVVTNVDSLDCMLDGIGAGRDGRYAMRLGSGGFSDVSRRLYVVDGEGTALACESVDLGSGCDPATHGPIDSAGAEACTAIEEPLARAECAWGLMALSDSLTCE